MNRHRIFLVFATLATAAATPTPAQTPTPETKEVDVPRAEKPEF